MSNLSSFKDSEFFHQPVLEQQFMESLEQVPAALLDGGLMIDATLGGGGHSALALEKHQNLKVIGIDQDPLAIKHAKQRLLCYAPRVEIISGNFSKYTPSEKAIFVLADLGVSSSQLNIPQRGFSFQNNGPIDMRMNQAEGITAAKLIEIKSESELADIIYTYGEEKLSRRIAKKIKLDLAENGPYEGTGSLAYAISGCYPKKMRYRKIHPATRTFQALRIAVNNELNSLDTLLKKAPSWLHLGGYIGIISFHSLEDRRVKHSFINDDRLERISKKPLVASEKEKESNPRSRSAKYRYALRTK